MGCPFLLVDTDLEGGAAACASSLWLGFFYFFSVFYFFSPFFLPFASAVALAAAACAV
jgi:hypothetical protein